MIGIIVAFKILIFFLCLAAALAALIFVPVAIYGIPYWLWVGTQNTIGKHLDKKKEGLLRTVRNATILYTSWILRKKPNF